MSKRYIVNTKLLTKADKNALYELANQRAFMAFWENGSDEELLNIIGEENTDIMKTINFPELCSVALLTN